MVERCRTGSAHTALEWTTLADQELVDWEYFEKSRSELGPGFIRILSYFHEDGVKSLAQIEDAMRRQNTAALVIPAHTLKGEARQFGANPLGEVAELIENTARICIETHRFPDELVKDVVELRRIFEQTIALFDKATNPLQSRGRAPVAGGFGRKVTNQGFGRL
jgi:HPt (histidine-containing phosphotransfer) domain-containing protein